MEDWGIGLGVLLYTISPNILEAEADRITISPRPTWYI